MDFGFFKKALKLNTPVTLTSVFILYLLKPMFDDVGFITAHPLISLSFFIVAINAFLLVVFFSKNEISKKSKTINIKNNVISGNKSKGLSVLTNGDIIKNRVTNNETDGDIIIGQRPKNGK
ncbi:hypothetical protein [Ewingella americana]|uniref:Uncharacterized protein n=2 Tax=Ewingella americana TaxID=41202 RepID=A0A085GAR3_EWIA3|nr:hypothetical protein [Ewingella americana]KAA8730185.1 hypothetical protein F4W05_08330 [Ewingella americana]KFC80808.1 hypothetical protein GEAM_2130 [Ewingella americana ATCC 33852]STQ44133.1 Uncharacterised protein [Ewingella americana]